MGLSAGGRSNTASGDLATIGGGTSNSATNTYATVPGGLGGVANRYGQMAYANGYFTAAGNAQMSTYILRKATTNATPTELFLDGSSLRLAIASNRVLTFDILIVGTATASGDSAGYRLTGVIKNIGGTTSFVGSPNKTVFGEDVAAWDADVVADDANDALVVEVTGAAATNIRWVSSVRTSEVGY